MRILIALILCLLAWPAAAEPITATVAATLAISTFWASVIVYTVAFVASVGLSYLASALLRPPKPAQNQGSISGGSAQQSQNMITLREPIGVRNIVYGQRRVAGKIVFAHVTDNNRFLHMVVVFAGHEIEGFHTIYLNDRPISLDGNEMVDSGEFKGLIRLKRHLGAASQGADGTLVNETRNLWQTTDRLRGCAYIYMRAEFEPSFSNPTYGGKVYQGGVPNLTAELRGKKVYDPRTGTTYWSANSALCLADYLTDPLYGIGISYSDINSTALIAAANACDEAVALDGGGTEPRYETDGELLSSAEPQENIGFLLGAMHGRLHYDGDRWNIIAGVYVSPTIDLSDDDLRAGPTIPAVASRRDLFNSVKGTFANRINNYIRGDFPPYYSDDYVAGDGEQIWKDIDLPLTVTASRARRIAKIELLRGRQWLRPVMPCKLTAWKCQAGDTIRWTSSRYGWTGKLFEVRKATLVQADDGALGVDLHLEETAPAIYDWNASTADSYDPSPDTNFPTAATCMPPSNLRVTETLYSGRNGAGVKARVTLAWDASPDAYLDRYKAYYRAAGGTVWTALGDTDELTADWSDAQPGLFDFAVLAVNYRGVSSTALLVRQSIVGLSAKPAAPTNVSVVPMGNVHARMSFDRAIELDVLEGGSIHIRHSPLTSGAAWADGTTLGNPLPGNATDAFLPLKAGTYMVKKLDVAGNYSDETAVVQTQQSALAFTLLTGGELIEHSAFGGAKTNCVVDAGVLRIAGVDDFDSVVDVDALSSFDFPGGVITQTPFAIGVGDGTVVGDPAAPYAIGRGEIPSAYYDWSAPVDLGASEHCRLTVTCRAQVSDVFDDFDSRAGEVDGWASWDGSVIGDEADAWTVIQTTDDDPANPSATWSAWHRVDAGEFEKRGYRLRTFLTSKDGVFNISIDQLSVAVEGVV